MASVIDTARVNIRSGRAEQAAGMLRKHLAIRPRDADAWAVLSAAMLAQGEAPAALAAAERVCRLEPGRPEAHTTMAAALMAAGNPAEGTNAFEHALQLGPAFPASYRAWGDALIRTFHQDAAPAMLERGIDVVGDDPGLLLSLCYALNVAPVATPSQERAWHQRLARAYGGPVAAGRWHKPQPGRPLRVAILSADFREHSCAFFLEGPLIELDRAKIALYLYSTTGEPDGFTKRLQKLGEWRECGHLNPDQIAALARQDEIDVLVDAGGWTVASHIPALARRLAPVQITYLGYPSTTGLEAMNARLVDAHTDPVGSEDACTEKLLRLPGCFVCFRAGADWPSPQRTAFQRGEGPPVFGSFNNAAKLAPEVVKLWSRVMNENPRTKLLLKASGLTGCYAQRLRDRFAAHGVDAARVEFAPFAATTHAHVAAYARVDVALDAFPYNGTTTTCEALWMGVPVVTLAGDRHRARVGVSLLHAAGRPEWIARSEDEYASIAARLIGDPARLGELRDTLRGEMSKAPLCDAARFAREFEAALLQAARGESPA